MNYSSQKETGCFEQGNGACTGQHDQSFQNTRLDRKLKQQSLSEVEYTKLGHEQSAKTTRKWKTTRERRHRYTIEYY